MALQFKISKDDHAALDEALQAFYVEADDGYQLDVEGIDDGKELKEALRKEREERAAAKKRAQELETEAEQKERERLEAQQEYQQLYQKEQETRSKTEKELQELRDKVANGERTSVAERLAASLIDRNATGGVQRYELLKQQALQHIQHTPEGPKINGPDGDAWDDAKLGEHLKTQYPFLVDGSKASGGGAPGSDGGGAASKKISRADFDQMGHAERAAHFKDGGTVTDTE